MVKKIFAAFMSAALLFLACGCSQSGSTSTAKKDTITVQTFKGDGSETTDITIPRDPQRVAVLDMAALDILDSWGLGSRAVGMPKKTRIDYLSQYNDDPKIANLGTVKEVDMEALMASKPEVIFIGPRLADEYDKLSEIAPVILTRVDYEKGYLQSFKDNLTKISAIFDKQEQAKEQIADIEDRVVKLNPATSGKTAVMGMVTSSNFNTLGNNSAGSLLFKELGFKNLAGATSALHGDSASLELLVELNPEYIFVLDRDSAINKKGAQTAKQVMDNAVVKKTDAYKKERIIYLSPEVWYLVTGGVKATDVMLSDIEEHMSK